VAAESRVELSGLVLETEIGTYGPEDVVPEAHVLDLALGIAPELVLVAEDSMAAIFDYDPLIAELRRLAADGPYETQERLVTRMAAACARQPEIRTLDIALRKRPVHGGTGELGVRLTLDAEGVTALRAGPAPG
jgi:dihydroneopterin aldolase